MISLTENTLNIDERDNTNNIEQKKYIFKQQTSNQESLCVRVIRKKYKCIMLLLAIAFILLEILKMILQTQQSVDDLKIILLYKYFSQKNITLQNAIKHVGTSHENFPEYIG